MLPPPFFQLPFLLDSCVILLAICAMYFVAVEVGDRTVGRIFFFFLQNMETRGDFCLLGKCHVVEWHGKPF